MARRFESDEQLASSWPHLTRQQVGDFQTVFNFFDSDHSGTITVKELKEVLKLMGQRLSTTEVERMLSAMDFDQNGSVDFVEFLLLMLKNTEQEDPLNEMVEFIALFDKDDSGTLQADELRRAMVSMGERLTDEEIEDALRLADLSGDGLVQYEEFVKYVLDF